MKGRCLRLFTHTRKALDLRAFAHAVATDVNIGTLAAKLTEEAVWASASKI